MSKEITRCLLEDETLCQFASGECPANFNSTPIVSSISDMMAMTLAAGVADKVGSSEQIKEEDKAFYLSYYSMVATTDHMPEIKKRIEGDIGELVRMVIDQCFGQVNSTQTPLKLRDDWFSAKLLLYYVRTLFNRTFPTENEKE